MRTNDWASESPSITVGKRARDLFTNRRAAIFRFCEYLNEDPPLGQGLFFFGDGGEGKSLLLGHLFEHYQSLRKYQQ